MGDDDDGPGGESRKIVITTKIRSWPNPVAAMAVAPSPPEKDVHDSRRAAQLPFQFVHQPHRKIFGPPRWRDNAVGKCFPQFSRSGSRFLRSREVFLQSGRAPDGHSAADPDKFAGSDVKHFLVFEVKDLLFDLHAFLP